LTCSFLGPIGRFIRGPPGLAKLSQANLAEHTAIELESKEQRETTVRLAAIQDRRDVLEKAGVTIRHALTKGARHHYAFTFAATPAVPDIRTFYSLTSAEEYFHTLHKDGAPPSLNLAGGQGAIEEGSRNKSRRRTTNRSDRRRRRRRSSFGWPS
jgi:hypothetical protein